MNLNLDILKDQAIEAAIKGKWEKAIELNQKIINQVPEDLEAHLRLGFAYLQIGDLSQAKKSYLKALRIQPGNKIASNNLEKIKILIKTRQSLKLKNNKKINIDPNIFLDIPGKTKVVSLVNLGQINVLAKLEIGQKVNLKIKKRRIEIRTENNEYIGALPDDISKRLIIFIKGGSQYLGYIKEVSKKNVDVFIKEIKKGRRLKQYPSFPKNIQTDLKIITGEEIEETENQEEIIDEAPIDFEKLAEELEEKEIYPEIPHDEELEEEFEE